MKRVIKIYPLTHKAKRELGKYSQQDLKDITFENKEDHLLMIPTGKIGELLSSEGDIDQPLAQKGFKGDLTGKLKRTLKKFGNVSVRYMILKPIQMTLKHNHTLSDRDYKIEVEVADV